MKEGLIKKNNSTEGLIKPNIIIVRHGSAQDEKGSMGGWSDTPLSSEGRKEIMETANNLPKGITKIYSSDLERAKESAGIIAKKLGLKVEYLKGLRSWNMGDFSGKNPRHVEPVLERMAQEKPNATTPNGESFNSYKNRFLKTIKKIEDENKKDKVIVITHSHGTRLIDAWEAEGKPSNFSVDIEKYDEPSLKPGGIKMHKP
jgi:broad specificity phosphatase PhoE